MDCDGVGCEGVEGVERLCERDCARQVRRLEKALAALKLDLVMALQTACTVWLS